MSRPLPDQNDKKPEEGDQIVDGRGKGELKYQNNNPTGISNGVWFKQKKKQQKQKSGGLQYFLEQSTSWKTLQFEKLCTTG